MSGANTSALESAIYRGAVRHRRFTPRRHSFKAPLFMLWLKVEEIPALLQSFWQLGSGAFCWGRFRRADYIGAGAETRDGSVTTAVQNKIAALAGIAVEELEGQVYMLCHLRYLGFYFSPLTLYYLRQNGKFTYLLAEVSNTPWKERHYYLLDVEHPQPHDKTFHVSPFKPMDLTYHWRIKPPDRFHKHCSVHIESRGRDHNADKIFDATLVLRRLPLNQNQLTRVLIRTPMQTLSIVAGIHWQALKLFIKRLPIYKHPEGNRIANRKRT